MQTYKIHIEGYWRDKNKQGLPGYSGIYFVYRSKYNPENDTITLLKVLYVGESEHVRDDIVRNASFAYWLSFLARGEELCFSVAEMTATGRTAVRAAIVYKLKPPANTEFKESPWQTGFEVLITGRTKLLPDHFIIQ